MSHQLSRALGQNGVKDSRPGYMWLFAKLQTTTTITELDWIFKMMCKLPLSNEKTEKLLNELRAVTSKEAQNETK